MSQLKELHFHRSYSEEVVVIIFMTRTLVQIRHVDAFRGMMLQVTRIDVLKPKNRIVAVSLRGWSPEVYEARRRSVNWVGWSLDPSGVHFEPDVSTIWLLSLESGSSAPWKTWPGFSSFHRSTAPFFLSSRSFTLLT